MVHGLRAVALEVLKLLHVSLGKFAQLSNWEELFLMFFCYTYELCIQKLFSEGHEISRNQRFAVGICCFWCQLLGKILIILYPPSPLDIS